MDDKSPKGNDEPQEAPTVEGQDVRVTIRTSEKGWLARLAKSYRERKPALLVDDGDVGVDPSTHTLWDMGRRVELRREEWIAVLVALGMVGAGIAMTIAAILDPEPTSKLSLLIVGGILCTVGGGFSAIRVLTKEKPPDVKFSRFGIEIRWR
ncbi:hypothetical protein ACFL6C_00405 [Myxococcota bacterium]